MRFANPFKDWRPAGAAMMLEPFDRIKCREFTPINFLLKLEWNRWGKRLASDLNGYSSEVMGVHDRDDIPYSHKYLDATSTKSTAYLCSLRLCSHQRLCPYGLV